jgi:hypothetical protein
LPVLVGLLRRLAPPRSGFAIGVPAVALLRGSATSPTRRLASAGTVGAVSSVDFTPGGPPETVLDPESPIALAALAEALSQPEQDRRDAVSAVVARWPRFLDAWARLGELARDEVEAYAAFRVGYHRGLDRLRQNGWRGSGWVRWAHHENRGFLRALHGLMVSAAGIGETDEEERCALFLAQLDPDWPPSELG